MYVEKLMFNKLDFCFLFTTSKDGLFGGGVENSCHIALIDGLPTVINVKLHWYVCVITGMMLLKVIFFCLWEAKIVICNTNNAFVLIFLHDIRNLYWSCRVHEYYWVSVC